LVDKHKTGDFISGVIEHPKHSLNMALPNPISQVCWDWLHLHQCSM